MQEYDAIVIGAGVIGPTIATSLARQGRSVLIIERDWSEPNRFVGELLQPGGLLALKEMGMAQAVNNIEAIEHKGYYISFKGQSATLQYPFKDSPGLRLQPVEKCCNSSNARLVTDSTLNMEEWEKDERARGVAFHHGRFLNNLREMAKSEPNVTTLEATVNKILYDEDGKAVGVSATFADKSVKEYRAKLTFATDGIYSKFRRELNETKPDVGSHFVALELLNANLPKPNHGHVIINDSHAPVLIYQIGPSETRMLCAYNSGVLPSKSEVLSYLNGKVLPGLPVSVQPSVKKALASDSPYRIMPNQFLVAKQNTIPGFICIGDSLNMRHPLTGGGMTVGLRDAALLCRLLGPTQVDSFNDTTTILEQLAKFHKERKNLDSVINVLSIALFSLFAAESRYLHILQSACFRYFLKGGTCVSEPMGLLSGVIPRPVVLFRQFFTVATYGIAWNFQKRGLNVPLALYESFMILATAVRVFTPYMWSEFVS